MSLAQQSVLQHGELARCTCYTAAVRGVRSRLGRKVGVPGDVREGIYTGMHGRAYTTQGIPGGVHIPPRVYQEGYIYHPGYNRVYLTSP